MQSLVTIKSVEVKSKLIVADMDTQKLTWKTPKCMYLPWIIDNQSMIFIYFEHFYRFDLPKIVHKSC